MFNNKWVFLIIGVLVGVYVVPMIKGKVAPSA